MKWRNEIKLEWDRESDIWFCERTVQGRRLEICAVEWWCGYYSKNERFVDFKISIADEVYWQCEVFKIAITARQLTDFCEKVTSLFSDRMESYKKYAETDIFDVEDILRIAYNVFGRQKCEVFQRRRYGYNATTLKYASFTPAICSPFDKRVSIKTGIIKNEPEIKFPGTRYDSFD